ncbi:superoxide dismutase [Suicoccus acidiformans]|uniref:Superoxide dismutase n=1 Tax=Suicoccus acidiformans TaxID=2036206 RepID=A0A347WMR8_9LACT|nr:superoxide dismutase family protein [Suicoccus acidiformans]AXY26375.1 superoxide dismutase [Suicoccus acidiformans]
MGEEIIVTMLDVKGEEHGTATFVETETGVKMTYAFYNLPEGEFAMHIHETGLASPEKEFTDADSHWNPTGVEHGHKSETGPHLGDLPNIFVDADGKSTGEVEIKQATFVEDPAAGRYSLANDGQGTALIVHVGPDDYHSQPTGAAGDRQLGGVIVPKQ